MEMESGDMEIRNAKWAVDDEQYGHGRFRWPLTLRVSLLMLGAPVAVVACCLLFYRTAVLVDPFNNNTIFFFITNSTPTGMPAIEESKLEKVLKDAAMEDKKTVIITTLNDAWASPDAVFDVFLESFRMGNQTKKLLDHLVVVALDQKAYSRCLDLHSHCYSLVSKNKTDLSKDAYFMTPNYLDMMWRRTEFLRIVLKLGYSFVFTDADIMWFRNPFPRFYSDAEFQIACDHFGGDPLDMNNWPNGGFFYVKSSDITIEFYNFWIGSRIAYPGMNEQDVLNKIKGGPKLKELGLTFKFLDTKFFGGFCEHSGDFDSVCTMHANCCFGLDNKVNDLKVLLEDWRKYLSFPSEPRSWSIPQKCSLEYHPPVIPLPEDEARERKGAEN